MAEGFGRKRTRPVIGLDELREKIAYDETTGIFTWRRDGKGWRGIRRGTPAGSTDPTKGGYRYIRIGGTDYLAQRLAWFYHYGEWPEGIIRFNDGNVQNCAISNLRNSSVTLSPGAKYDWRTKEGRSAQRKAYYTANRDRVRNTAFQAKFGISLAQYHELLEAQGGACAICGRPESAERNGKVRWLAIDHCHNTNKVRGLLCGSCNPMIGYARDNIEVLEKAVAYLKRNGEAV